MSNIIIFLDNNIILCMKQAIMTETRNLSRQEVRRPHDSQSRELLSDWNWQRVKGIQDIIKCL